MGIRGEIYSNRIAVEGRTYFFNVKENRMGDVFLNIVESKPAEGDTFDRRSIVIFKDDMRDFLGALDGALKQMEKTKTPVKKSGADKDRKRIMRDGMREGAYKDPEPGDDRVFIGAHQSHEKRPGSIASPRTRDMVAGEKREPRAFIRKAQESDKTESKPHGTRGGESSRSSSSHARPAGSGSRSSGTRPFGPRPSGTGPRPSGQGTEKKRVVIRKKKSEDHDKDFIGD